MTPDDVLVVGGGPAGRALAGACAARGLRTTLLDRAPEAPWRITYGSWAAELPLSLPPGVVAARARGRAVALTAHDLGWEYAVLDVPALRAHLDAGLADVRVRAGRAVGTAGHGGVLLADGSTLRARLVVDAGGRRQPLGDTATPRVAAEQTAFGVVVDERAAAPLVTPGQALFMDWRSPGGPGHARWPSFLYGVPLGGGPVLLEETSLARRPGLPVAVLRRRLLTRLAHHGVPVPRDASGAADTERVRFPVDTPRHTAPGVLAFGAAAPLVHPATGFSVATALTLAPRIAAAVSGGGASDPDGGLAAARSVLWPAAAVAVHRLRRIGLEALLRMPAAEVPGFFEVFLALPERHRWAYLTGRDDLRGALAAMGALFTRSDGRLRRRLVLPALLPAAPAAVEPIG